MGDDSKLKRALADAAIGNINEDIQSILASLEKITTDIPKEVSKRLILLTEDINSLSLGLKAVPENFDIDFSKKINRILDVAAEIEDQNKKYQKILMVDLETILSNYVNNINEQLINKIGDNFIIKDSTMYLTMFVTSLLGGLVAASGVAFILINLP
jgi:AAA+ ATPase superfamily predicted ATPase